MKVARLVGSASRNVARRSLLVSMTLALVGGLAACQAPTDEASAGVEGAMVEAPEALEPRRVPLVGFDLQLARTPQQIQAKALPKIRGLHLQYTKAVALSIGDGREGASPVASCSSEMLYACQWPIAGATRAGAARDVMVIRGRFSGERLAADGVTYVPVAGLYVLDGRGDGWSLTLESFKSMDDKVVDADLWGRSGRAKAYKIKEDDGALHLVPAAGGAALSFERAQPVAGGDWNALPEDQLTSGLKWIELDAAKRNEATGLYEGKYVASQADGLCDVGTYTHDGKTLKFVTSASRQRSILDGVQRYTLSQALYARPKKDTAGDAKVDWQLRTSFHVWSGNAMIELARNVDTALTDAEKAAQCTPAEGVRSR